MALPAPSNAPVILFDGVCNFCDGAVNFVLKRDRKALFRFAPLQSSAGQAYLRLYNLSQEDLDSFVLVDNGKVYKKSSAALRVMNGLSWHWKPLQIFRLIPPPLRDAVYDFIARHRYKWFGKKDSCMIPSAEIRSRFITD
jgi:predicted DCC family thiol-disulfide oxidoreductase YuxK